MWGLCLYFWRKDTLLYKLTSIQDCFLSKLIKEDFKSISIRCISIWHRFTGSTKLASFTLHFTPGCKFRSFWGCRRFAIHVHYYFSWGRECSGPSYASIWSIGGETNGLGGLSVRPIQNLLQPDAPINQVKCTQLGLLFRFFLLFTHKHLNCGNTNTIFAVGNLAPAWFYLGAAPRQACTLMRFPNSQYFPY